MKTLIELANELVEASVKFSPIAKKSALKAFQSPEYKAHKAAYRLFWDAYDKPENEPFRVEAQKILNAGFIR